MAERGVGFWPTPTVNDSKNNGGPSQSKRHEPGLNTVVKNWPTPTVADTFTGNLKSDQRKEGSMHSVNLSQAIHMWPTPTVQDYKGRGPNSSQQGLADVVRPRPGSPLSENTNTIGNRRGPLNPAWEEALMGWPIGWTALKPLETDKYQEWWQKHGEF